MKCEYCGAEFTWWKLLKQTSVYRLTCPDCRGRHHVVFQGGKLELNLFWFLILASCVALIWFWEFRLQAPFLPSLFFFVTAALVLETITFFYYRKRGSLKGIEKEDFSSEKDSPRRLRRVKRWKRIWLVSGGVLVLAVMVAVTVYAIHLSRTGFWERLKIRRALGDVAADVSLGKNSLMKWSGLTGDIPMFISFTSERGARYLVTIDNKGETLPPSDYFSPMELDSSGDFPPLWYMVLDPEGVTELGPTAHVVYQLADHPYQLDVGRLSEDGYPHLSEAEVVDDIRQMLLDLEEELDQD